MINEFSKKYSLSCYHTSKHTGVWRILIYWESKRTKEIMLTLCISKDCLTAEQQSELESLMLKNFDVGSKIDDFSIVSLSLIFSTSFSGGYSYEDEIKYLGSS